LLEQNRDVKEQLDARLKSSANNPNDSSDAAKKKKQQQQKLTNSDGAVLQETRTQELAKQKVVELVVSKPDGGSSAAATTGGGGGGGTSNATTRTDLSYAIECGDLDVLLFNHDAVRDAKDNSIERYLPTGDADPHTRITLALANHEQRVCDLLYVLRRHSHNIFSIGGESSG
jgi:hypothetical protein